MSIIEEKTLLKSGDSLGNETIHYPITKQDCISDLVSDRCVTYIIGTTLSGHTLADCDFLCTGTSDQIIINNAVKALGEYGGEIVLLQGKYSTTGQISLVSNLTFRGVGFVEIDRNNNGQTENAANGIYISSAQNVKIFDINIVNARFGFNLSYSSDCKIQDCSVNENTSHGYYVYYSSDCKIQDCSSNENTSHGYFLYYSNNCKIQDCSSNYCGGIGIYLYSSNNVKMQDCSCNYSTRYGIWLINISCCDIIGNTCFNNNERGLSSSGTFNNITGNICTDNGLQGIAFDGSNNTITGNTCNNNSDNGISVINSNNINNNVTGNTCVNNDGYGIYLLGSNSAVTGNICNNNNGYGIYLTSNSNIVVGNQCKDGIYNTGLNNVVENNYTE